MSGSFLFNDKEPGQTDLVKSLLFGVAVGDALGVPVEGFSENAVSASHILAHYLLM